MKKTIPILLAFLLGIVIWWMCFRTSRASAERTVEKAWQLLGAKDFEQKEQEVLRLIKVFPDLDSAHVLLATAAVQRHQNDEAISYFQRVSASYQKENASQVLSLARMLQTEGMLSASEGILRDLIKLLPDVDTPKRQLLGILRITGRNREALPLVQNEMVNGRVSLSELLMAMAPRGVWVSDADRRFLKQVQGKSTTDPLVGLALARIDVVSGRFEKAEPLLKDVARRFPEQKDVQLLLGSVLMELARDRDFDAWEATLHESINETPEIWMLRGLRQRRLNSNATAARCFAEAVRRDPRDMTSHYQLSQVLKSLSELELSRKAGDVADRMSRLHDLCVAFGKSMNPLQARQIIELLQELGWLNEALSCSRLSVGTWPELTWTQLKVEELSKLMADQTSASDGWTVFSPEFDVSRWPLPQKVVVSTMNQGGESTAKNQSAISFREEARDLGVQFQFYNGGALDQKQVAYMAEFSGAGVGVLDFDRDGWADLYLTQGAPLPLSKSPHSYRDALFRNLGNGRFTEVALLAGLDDAGYSQGPSVGDFDGDGFADIYLGNLGPNRLFRNNGDGTFSDVSQESQTAGDEWTISAAMVDLNGDGLSDIYVVNYLEGDDVHKRACFSGTRPVQCGPDLFPAAPDRVYLNQGDGRFRDITSESGFTAPNGKGMGVIAADLDGSRRLSIFVANDVTPNFLFQNHTASPSAPQFEERGIAAGVAFDVYGRAQSSMGVAVFDINDDGLEDLFVTNFLHEYNNLYLQNSEHFFEDAARRAGLYEGDHETEGWGTQFLDADGDGLVDLFVSNGHTESFVVNGQSLDEGRMRPHLYRNVGKGKLELQRNELLGPYFESRFLGRSVATWDWNRDGRTDLCVTHVDNPVAILTNQSPSIGGWLTIKLVGVVSSRDAIGSKVVVTAGDHAVTRQLVGGDGYASSNERHLMIALPSDQQSVDISIDWISGHKQTLRAVPVNSEVVIIEGRDEPAYHVLSKQTSE